MARDGRGLGFAEVVFALALVGGILEVVKGVAAFFMGIVTVDVDVLAAIEKAGGAYELHRDSGELRLLDPSFGERVVTALPHFLTGLTVVAVALLLLKVAMTSRDGSPFTEENARRLSVAGWVAGVGGMAAVVAAAWSQAVISAGAPDELNVSFSVLVSFTPLMVAGILIAISEVFRRGVAMRAELDEVI